MAIHFVRKTGSLSENSQNTGSLSEIIGSLSENTGSFSEIIGSLSENTGSLSENTGSGI